MENNKRFHCDCPEGYTGQQCEIKATSCASYAESLNKTHGLRVIHAPDNRKYSVYCHFTSQYAMTLVMSFSLENKDLFYSSLHANLPRNQDTISWADYRLSLLHMEGIRDHFSSHWIYTCSYQTRGVNEVDYLRSKFSENDILTFDSLLVEDRCKKKAEYINIEGASCEECIVSIGQSVTAILFWNGLRNCNDLSGLNVPTCSGSPARYFGRYECVSRQFSCTKTSDSTTQLWFASYLG